MHIDHEVQLGIIKKLLFKPESRFSELNVFGLDNNHFNFHLRRLKESGILFKDGDIYRLTEKGLELAGRMDINTMEIVRQPKVGVSILVLGSDGRILMGKRLKNPGMGMVNFYTRKVKYGESLYETARLCLMEETGLVAVFKYRGTIRFLGLIDRVMICFLAIPTGGSLKNMTVESENQWFTEQELLGLNNTFEETKTDLAKYLSEEIFFEEKGDKNG